MNATNFKWADSIYIVANGIEYDMHNCFEFHCVIYDVAERSVELRWRRSLRHMVADDMPETINLYMKDVTEMRWLPRDSEMPFSEDDCLASFGYACDENRTDRQFWVETEPAIDWRWSFLFQSGSELQVAGDSANVTISP